MAVPSGKTKVHFKVEIDGAPYSEEYQTEPKHADSWQSVLKNARKARQNSRSQPPHIECKCCNGINSRQLSVRISPDGLQFSLARFPDTGPNHHIDCRFYGFSSKQAHDIYAKNVVEELDGNILHVKLSFARSISEGKVEASISTRAKLGCRHSLPEMTLRGLMDLLWVQAGLHQYRPEWAAYRLDRSGIASRILRAANTIRWGKVLLGLSLIVSDAPPGGGLKKKNRAVNDRARSENARAIIIGRLKDGDSSSAIIGGSRVPMIGGPVVYVDPAAADAANLSFKREIAAWCKGATIFAAMIVEPEPDKHYWRAPQIVLMRTSVRAIPLDSGHEARLEVKLANENRWFQKPLRFDASEDEVLPDFELLDVDSDGKPYPMEVWGRNEPKYLARKAEKRKIYDLNFGAKKWWEWDATITQNIPDFPPKKD